jgi:hypothetical protein
MSVQKFDKIFGISSTVYEEQIKFVNRIENFLFNNERIKGNIKLFKNACYELGEDAASMISIHNQYRIQIEEAPNFKLITRGDFKKTLRVIVAIYTVTNGQLKDDFSRLINDIISKSNIDIGVRWADGVFYPTGDKVLDEELIEKSLQCLEKYPNEKKDIKNALENHQAKKLDGVVENCYKGIEGLLRILFNNKKTLIDNKTELLGKLDMSDEWRRMIAAYIGYANEYHRHAGENRHDLKPNEVEAFLYLTCLLIKTITGYK